MATIVRKTEPRRLVSYYLEGWRFGYLESTKGAVVVIRPIVARGSTARVLRIPIADIKEV